MDTTPPADALPPCSSQIGPLKVAGGSDVEGHCTNLDPDARIPPTGILGRLRSLWRATEPVPYEALHALDRRWRELPEHVKTPEQVIGRHAIGCEGTHGVFPKCNLTCTPCYHSADANKVRIDGPHTLREIEQQMRLLRTVRGPRAHAQLIGGEVSLLDADDHAAAIQLMRSYGREPMSFTHGDFDEDYLRAVVLDQDGRRRIRRISFAVHFDSLMRGRRGIPRPRSEAELLPYRAAFAGMFRRLRREHGTRFFLAHNMTVTASNLSEVAEVVRTTVRLSYSMMSFQPAAYIGDDRRWREDLRAITPDEVWLQVERGVGRSLPWQALQFGDPRCTRTAIGWMVGPRWVPLLEPDDPRDLAVRDRFFERFGGMQAGDTHLVTLGVKGFRAAVQNLDSLTLAAGWARRAIRRSGGLRELARHRLRPMTFVMHMFMDAAEVSSAWQLLERGQLSVDPTIRATQERLQACAYSMAHPQNQRLVPACVQHSVLDPAENAELRKLLPLVEVR